MTAILKKIGRFIIPSDVELRKRRLELMVWSFLLSFAFYPAYFGFLAWFSLVRPLVIISRLRGREAFNAAYFFSFCFNVFSLYWVAMVTPPGTLAAVVIVSFYYTAVFMVFLRLYRIRALFGFIALPFLWVGMEYFRTLSQFAFPWSDLGYTQAYYLVILQIVALVSVHGLSFIIVTVNVLLWQVFRRELSPEKRLTSFFVSLAIVLVLMAYGWVVMPKYPEPGQLDIALLQGSIPLSEKWKSHNEEYSYNLYDSLAGTVSDSKPVLYIWPETSAPAYLTHQHYSRLRLGLIARQTGAYHLVGALAADSVNSRLRYYNSCFQFNPDGHIEKRYDKVKLVPFSEHVPYQDALPFLNRDVIMEYLTFIKKYNVQWWSDFYPGDSIVLFDLPGAQYGVLICFESTFPEYTRKMIQQGAEFIVGITNDTWFGNSVGIYMHARIFITRAVENRCWMARTANSGLSFIVDDYGRLRENLSYNEVAAVTGKIKLLHGKSFFTRHGDIIGLTSLLMLVSLCIIFTVIWLIQKTLLKK
ncbi:MAG: apolipoprotein N-acyltransferase [candidate division Zixibacteria bacterium]|nr:apolipoprotein N-acyltransferase [candidate division Zixibacteria bacterium]